MQERIDSLEVALKNERKEREFYLDQAKKTKNPIGKTMFKQIAAEELEHYEKLKELHTAWENKKKWPDTVPLTVNGTDVGRILDDLLNKTKAGEPGEADDLKAIRTAIEFEAAGTKFYERLRDQVTEPKEKEFFGLLARIEHGHFLSLKDTEEYLTNPSSWYLKTEGSGLDGA
ncbi:MAG: ferritin family protein [Smithellaceae bacterium]|nr:ferritin family protein [Smithellaceae bacterium]